jgi:diguanylate cyclase (GGDEF)-like protein/PAS domain S-box-containing protein
MDKPMELERFGGKKMNQAGDEVPAALSLLPCSALRRVFNATSVPYLIMAPDFTIVAANDAYLAATLTRREDIVGRGMFEVFPDNPQDPQAHGVAALTASLQRVLLTRQSDTMPVQKYDIRQPPEQGGGFTERYWSPVNSPVLDDAGNVTYIIHRVEDVSDFVRLKSLIDAGTEDTDALNRRIQMLEKEMFQRSRELQETNRRLREANEQLVLLDRAKVTFLGNVNHELRTPLALMLGPLEQLIQTAAGLSSEERSSLAMVYRNARRLLRLVNTLLDFTRIEAGRGTTAFELTDLSSFTCELASVFRSAVERAGLRLALDCPPLPDLVYVDRGMWEKIVLNLLSNAFKFTLHGTIEVTVRANGQYARLTVRDTGVGIPEHELAHIFERFHRIEETRGRTREGTGIGLALVQELVQLHQGTIRAESRIGEGSTFIVELPFGSAHLPADRVFDRENRVPQPTEAEWYADEALGWLPQPVEVGSDTAPDDRKERMPRILLAEDNADMRGYIVRLLGDHCQVEVAADGKAALAAIRARPPDLVLTDVFMLGLDGVELVRAIRRDSKTARLPIIILSASAAEEARVEGIKAGADDYLVKPFSGRELIARVERQLAESEHARRERELRAQAEAMKAHLDMVLESVSDAFIAVDRQWRITYANSKAAGESGMSRDTLIGRELWPAYVIDRSDPVRRMLDDCMQDRQSAVLDYLYAPTGHWWEVHVFPSPEGLVVFSAEITQRRLAELRLLKTQKRLQLAAEIAQLGFCEWNLKNDQVEFSAEWKRQLGYGSEELPDRLNEWLARLHPDDHDRVRQEIARIEASPQGVHEIEYRLCHRNGTWRWMVARMRPAPGGNGTVERLEVTQLDVTERKEAEKNERQLAQHDPVTGLPNRALMQEQAGHMIAAAKRARGKLAVLFFDLDRFKTVNDTYGHHVGDELLREVARRITRSMRAEDFVSRVGGDEFVAVAQIHDERDAARIARHALELLAQPCMLEGLELQANASIGISLFPRDGDDLDTLIRCADAAMYYAKQQGCGHYQFFTDELDRLAKATLQLEYRLRQALERGEFALYYQAVLDKKTGAVAGVEALLRWPQPDSTSIEPQQFVPVAEAAGLMPPLGAWVLREALRQQQTWQEAGLPALPMGVNVSPMQLHHQEFIPELARVLSDSGMPPNRLILELPERAVAGEGEQAVRTIRQLKELGVRVELGDVGIGPSRLDNLARLPIDRLKVDHTLVQHVRDDSAIPALVDVMIAMGRTLRLEIVVEGIETADLLEFAQARDCDQVQGYYLCRPMPGAEFAKWYREHA